MPARRIQLSMEKTLRYYESSTIAQYYSKYRPTYPKELFEKAFSFAAKHGVGDNMAVDLACGSGQSTFPLCDQFRRVVGVDISKAQIECALEKAKALGRNDDVEFVVCPASKLPFEDESVDLMTCAAAWHWLDPDTVFLEIDRVLKRPGALAVYTYGPPILFHQQLRELFTHMWENVCIWQYGPYGNVRRIVENRYQDVKLPYPLAERHDMQQENTMSLEDLEGFVNSWDSYEAHCKQNPGSTALEDMVQGMKKLLLEKEGIPVEISGNTHVSDVSFHFTTPFFLLLAIKN